MTPEQGVMVGLALALAGLLLFGWATRNRAWRGWK